MSMSLSRISRQRPPQRFRPHRQQSPIASTSRVTDPDPDAGRAIDSGAMSGLSMLSSLSDEYLVLIFEQLLPSHTDLHAVCLVNKRFYSCGIRAMYRSIRYSDQASYFSNLKNFWHDGPGQTARMKSAPQSVTFTGMWSNDWRSPWTPLRDAEVWDNNGTDDHIHKVRQDKNISNACSDLFAHLLGFISLRTLVFQNCHLPDKESLSLILQGMPRLRNLTIKECVFMEQPIPHNSSYGVISNLPLTSLAIVKTRVSRHQHSAGGNWSLSSPIRFILAPTLTTLEFTWDDAFVEMYMLDSSMGTQRIGVSPLIERLTIHTAGHRSDINSVQLLQFLRNECQNVRWFEISDWHGDFVRGLEDDSVLPRMESYVGPGCLVRTFVHPSCREVHLTGPEQSVAATTKMLEHVHRGVAVLTFVIAQWEKEILFAISQMFDNLEELKIYSRQGRPDEETYLVMPLEFFTKYNKLRVLHVYELGMNVNNRVDIRSFASVLDRSKRQQQATPPTPQVMCGLWNRACPALREVQWMYNAVLKRLDNDWNMIKHSIPGVEDSEYAQNLARSARNRRAEEDSINYDATNMISDDDFGDDEDTFFAMYGHGSTTPDLVPFDMDMMDSD